MRDINRELLQLAGFEGEDLENFLPRWLETAKALQLTDEKVAYAVDHYIPENWDIKYLGVRKTIGAYLREAPRQGSCANKRRGYKPVPDFPSRGCPLRMPQPRPRRGSHRRIVPAPGIRRSRNRYKPPRCWFP